MEYLTAKQIIGKLKQGRVMDISEAYFSQLVKTGFIPSHTMPGKRRKLYLYDEVKEMLDTIKDPSREPQREANKRKREENKLEHMREKWDSLEEYYMDALKLFEITIEELEQLTGFKGGKLDELKKSLFSEQLQNNNHLEILDEIQNNIDALDVPAHLMLDILFTVYKPLIYELVTFQEFMEEIIPWFEREYE